MRNLYALETKSQNLNTPQINWVTVFQNLMSYLVFKINDQGQGLTCI